MTRVFEAPTAGRCTRALVIGVGAYPLAKPSYATAHTPKPLRNVKDIASAATGAALFSDWLIENGHLLTPPLASVDLLLNVDVGGTEETKYGWSGRVPNTQGGVDPRGGALDVDPPDVPHVRQAGLDWMAQIGKDDQAVLYICGHGVAKGSDSVVFLSDLNSDPGNPWGALLNISNHARALKKRDLASAVFIIDACGEQLQDIKEVEIGTGAQFAYNNPDRQAVEKVAFLAASPEGGKAYDGPLRTMPNVSVGRFTQCVIEALNGAAADDHSGGGDWVVRPNSLMETLPALYRRRIDWADRPFSPVPAVMPASPTPMLRFAQPPHVPVRVVFDPQETEEWVLEIRDHQDGPVDSRQAHPPVVWETQVQASLYPYVLMGNCPAQPQRNATVQFNPMRGRIEQRLSS